MWWDVVDCVVYSSVWPAGAYAAKIFLSLVYLFIYLFSGAGIVSHVVVALPVLCAVAWSRAE